MATVNYQSILAQIDLQDFLNRDEKGDSEFFAQMFKGQAVYDHAGKVWYLWLGQYWELDAVQDVIGYVMNRVASEYQFKAATERKHGNSAFEKILLDRAKKLHSLKRAKNVLEIARSEPEIRIAGTEWDSNPDLLPVNNGVIDLKTGKMRDALPTEYIRHHSPVDWIDLKEPCPLWDKTLLGIFDGNTEMIDFIQRLFGYAITGHVTEHRLPIFLGESARNGKTTIFEALHNILGDDFSASIPMNTFMKKKYASNGPEPYLEKLNGKRLAYSSESAEGIKLDTALIKSLTGGDTLNPRGMYKDPKAFKPTHKLMLFTNYKPKVDDSDNGTWDRILLIPLVMRFVDNPTKPNERKKDKDLGEKLKAEYSGILAWLVRGCLEWRKQGLNPPASVLAATDDYRDGEDELAEFIDDICILGAGHTVKVSALFGRYLAWTRQMGIDNLPLKDFKTRMKRKFGDPKKTNKGWFYQGIS